MGVVCRPAAVELMAQAVPISGRQKTHLLFRVAALAEPTGWT